ncbi:MAG: carboxymuconolactone decarboxylase family protein [Variovorax sp.]
MERRRLLGVNAALDESMLGKRLIHLVFLRVSQLNGCAFCVDMHARELLAAGEDPQRLNSLVTWREVPFFSERERAALNWAESLTRLIDTHAPDEDFEALRAHFDEREIVELTLAVAQINVWNRLGVGMRAPVAVKPLPAAQAA